MSVGKSFFDQYSVICVLGSVVGCVVVPLITQSVESLILSAILISITAKTLSSKTVPPGNELREDRRRIRDKDPLVEKKVKKKKLLPSQPQPSSQGVLNPDELRQREDDLRQQEEQLARDKERRLEEKREKKARKREERLKRREEERKEKEEKEQLRKEKDDFRASRKSESRPLSPPSDQVTGVSVHKSTHHERHSSTSSTTSNSSTHTSSRYKCHSSKTIATPSDTLLHIAPIVQPSPSSHFKGWQPLPPAQGPLTWQPDMPPRHMERLQKERRPCFKQSQVCSILQQHKEVIAQELPLSQTDKPMDKPVETLMAQVGLESQRVLDCNQSGTDNPQQPPSTCNSDIWASSHNGYYTLFSTSGHTLFGNTILPPSWSTVNNWPDV